MDTQKLTIGQMADLNHVSRQTLRHYEAEGLLIPNFKAPKTSYRYYNLNQCAKLDMIQYLKFCGMSLTEIKKHFENGNIDNIKEFLTTQVDFIDESISRLRQSRRLISQTIENYSRYKYLSSRTIFHEYLPQRKIYVHASDLNFFDESDSSYELMVHELKASLLDKKMPMSYFSNIGTIMRRPCLEQHILYSNEVFVFIVDDDTPDSSKIQPDSLETISEGMYVSMCSEDIFQESEHADQLLNYIKENNYTIAGDYLCEVVTEFPVFDKAQRSMLYKIQIPIKSNSANKRI